MLLVLILVGLREYHLHKLSLASIPIRVHVNGSRGKSSVTRLVAAGLRAGGLRTVAKTTGSAPRIIDLNGNDKIIHRLRSASIGEQVKLLRFFAQDKPDALVIECMAVMPQYQWVAEQKMVKSTIGVITNVRPDHLEEMGPKMTDICASLSNTIPFKGIIVTAEHDYAGQLKMVADKRETQFYEVHDNEIGKEYMSQFPYLEHAENVALALKVCELAGVDQKKAMDGLIHAKPDPGALVLWNLESGENKNQFVSAFAANDPQSTLQIWRLVDERIVGNPVCVFLNSRPDRRTRTAQLLEIVAEEIQPEMLVIRGENLPSNLNKLATLADTNIKVFPYAAKTDQVVEFINSLDNHFIFGMGNMVGWGDEFVKKLKRYRVNG